MSDTTEVVNVPEDTKFIKNPEEGKNATAVIIDHEHNKKLEEEIASKDVEKSEEVTNTISEESSNEPSATVVEHELTDEEKGLSIEHQKIFEEAIENPSILKVTDSERAVILEAKIMDSEFMNMMIDAINSDVDELIASKDDPEHEYSKDIQLRDKTITETINIKYSLREMLEASKELRDPEFIETAFNQVYPRYKSEGPAYILNDFVKYLNKRSEEKSLPQLIKDLNSEEKIKKIFETADSEMFRYLTWTDVKDEEVKKIEYKSSDFIKSMFNWNLSLIREKFGKSPEDPIVDTFKASESCLIVFCTTFFKFMYKYLAKDTAHRSLARKLIHSFIVDNSNPSRINAEHFKDLTDAWNLAITKCIELSEICYAELK